MNTIKKEQRTFIERLYCDCGAEAGEAFRHVLTFPIEYYYYCKECEKKIVTTEIYPKITYEEK